MPASIDALALTKMAEQGGNLVPTDETVTVTAEHVVTATGNHAQRTARLLGLKTPAIPVEHQYIVTEPDPALVEWRKSNPEHPVLRDADGRWRLTINGHQTFVYGDQILAGLEQDEIGAELELRSVDLAHLPGSVLTRPVDGHAAQALGQLIRFIKVKRVRLDPIPEGILPLPGVGDGYDLMALIK